MKSINIYDENKYNDEPHSKTASDTLVIPKSIIYDWVATPFSEYTKGILVTYQTIPGTTTARNGRVYSKGDFMQFNIYPFIEGVWDSNHVST
ncbi:g361 [Yersinia phage phiR1-37]|uniref:hypothetical protein n=1 Tax=Yersinia phage phiR1-37 TaxID=331278 RepID=UPI00022DBE14|nr:hypothetical protein phiR1-37_gp361 [Yersinia phage phiR1-37]CCE26384.1 g361 [Yersinia phage phiR1-37]